MVAPSTNTPSKLKAKFTLDDFGLNEGWIILQRRWKTVLAGVLACWALGLLYCYFAQQQYESATQIFVMRKDSSMVATGGTPGAGTQDPQVSEDMLATQMDLIRSKRLVSSALERTIKLSELNALKAKEKQLEVEKSDNLRYLVPRVIGMASKDSEEVAATTDPTAVVAPATDGVTPVVATDPAGAEAKPTEVASAVQATPIAAPASTPAPGAITTTTGEAPTDDNAQLVDQILDPSQIAELPMLTSDSRMQPPAILEDGDQVIMLAELPGIMENLETNQLPADYVIENLDVSRGGTGQARDAHMLALKFRHADPVETRLVVDALIRSYQTFLSEKFQNVSREAAKLIAGASKDLKLELDAAQRNLQLFREQSPILVNGDQTMNIHRTGFETASNLIIEIQTKLTESRARLEEVEQMVVQRETLGLTDLDMLALIDETNAARLVSLVAVSVGQGQTPGVLTSMPGLQGLETLTFGKLQEAIAELEGMKRDFGPNHPEVLKLKDRIASAQRLIDTKKDSMKLPQESAMLVVEPKMVMSAYLRLLRSDVSAMERREQLLSQIASEEEERAKALTSFELEALRLNEQVATSQTLYDAVIDRLRDINLAKDYSGFVNEVVEAPQYGAEVWPSIPIVLALSTVLGLMLGVGAAAVTDYRDRSFKDPDDIRRDLDATILTHVPDLRGLARDPKQLVEGSQVHPSIYAYHKPKSRESEVFRGLRTSLFFSSNGQKCQVIMFTSPNQGDGKSTVAANLAVSIAQTGRKVLVVDCDLRRPNTHKLLGVKNDVGLSDVIGGEVEPWDAIKQTETTNLWCLPSGPLPANPAELLQSTTFENFIKLAREKYDHVILDCPPVLAVADPCIVAPRADGITLVLRVSRDSRPQAVRAREMLARVNGRVLGVVVNASEEAAKSGYGRYGDSAHAYSYDYGYGKGYSRGYNKYYEEDATSERANGAGR